MNGERQSVEAGYAWGWLALFLLVGLDKGKRMALGALIFELFFGIMVL
jgi:hypothetical protein